MKNQNVKKYYATRFPHSMKPHPVNRSANGAYMTYFFVDAGAYGYIKHEKSSRLISLIDVK